VAEPNNFLNYMLLAETYLMTDKSYHALPVLEEALKLAPECIYLLTQQLTGYYRMNNRTLASKTIEQMKKVAPLSPLSLMYLANEAIENEDYPEAEKITEQLISILGETKSTLRRRINILAWQKKTENFNQQVNEAYKKFPEDSYFVTLQYRYEIGQNRKNKAKKILEQFLKNSYNEDLTAQYARLLFEMGKYQDGIKNLNRLIEFLARCCQFSFYPWSFLLSGWTI
jgi:predicted Zn-dependent protease